ncbi:MAG: divalent-cation tolerance protein CutA [Acidimicrobiales bacterium]
MAVQPTIVSVSITGPDAEWLAEHTRNLVDAGLVACGNIMPSIRSIYRWEGAIEDDHEASANLHTRDDHVPTIIERTNAAHPDDIFQILATEIVAADPAYHRWVLEATADPRQA